MCVSREELLEGCCPIEEVDEVEPSSDLLRHGDVRLVLPPAAEGIAHGNGEARHSALDGGLSIQERVLHVPGALAVRLSQLAGVEAVLAIDYEVVVGGKALLSGKRLAESGLARARQSSNDVKVQHPSTSKDCLISITLSAYAQD